ncbi:type II toxin-antitoxin system RelE/ParE family toxin [Spirulina major]|uniref:type II toxin-antitoxin system RelE/ParE family toxin n=1 Tax=Spirulina major TaxID=270636 RepID=UPI0009329377|nr:type II toxin-antitoxin system RelE/ParE family toxin [Spirulina major]
MKRLIIAQEASRDLAAISDYFLDKSVDAGERFVEKFGQKCQYLAQFPYLGKSYTFIDPDLRGISMLGYIIFYQIVDEGIEILRVVSGYRDVEQVFRDSEF